MTAKPYAKTPKLTRAECEGLFLPNIDRIDLRALRDGDIPILLRVIQNYLTRHGYESLSTNIYIKPDDLANRWQMSISCLNAWRINAVGPVYMKTGPGSKANVRYPMLGKHGVLEFERTHHFASTQDERIQQSLSNVA